MRIHLNRKPPVLTSAAPAAADSQRLSVRGQGTVWLATTGHASSMVIRLSSRDGRCACVLNLGTDRITLVEQRGDVSHTLCESDNPQLLIDPSATGQTYWLSLDSHNRCIRYGKGEPFLALGLLALTWAEDDAFEGVAKHLEGVQVQGGPGSKVSLLPNPVALTPSALVIPEDELSLEVIAQNSASVVSDLPPACQILYGHVAQRGVNLQPQDFPDFAEAIQYSINTPGALCHTKLLEKDPIFGYLRVTLDPNMGDSPGQPYVLEIWPAGNGSPIHNHGNSCAVIKVLHGQIQVSWFRTLSPSDTVPWGSVVAHAGDVTFLAPDCYQIHRLFNPAPKSSGSFCATIQCYRYMADDHDHYEFFDYLQNGEVKHFAPDSDWDYGSFKEAIRAEWLAASVQPNT